MDAAISDAIVTDYEGHIDGLVLPDTDDRHVLAAAIVGQADIIVTLNMRDFPSHTLDAYGIQAQHPDAFLASQFQLNEQFVLECARRCRRRLKSPEVTIEGYLDNLHRAGLVVLSAKLAKTRNAL